MPTPGAAVLWTLLACATDPTELTPDEEGLALALRWEAPTPDATNRFAEDAAAAALGQALFFDPGLSADGEVSCASCHDPTLAFSDPERLSEGQATTSRHAPPAQNAARQRWLFWDGRADSLWSQALGPLESPAEHGATRLGLAHRVAADSALSAAYTAGFGPLPDLSDPARFPAEGRPVPEDPAHPHALAWAGMQPADQDAVTEVFVHLGKAIAAYEAQLVTGPSAVDTHLDALAAGRPEDSPLPEEARLGLKLFVGEAGCVRCHSGPAWSDGEFHNLGLGERGWLPPEDPGRAEGIPRLLAGEFNAASVWSDDPEGPKAQDLAGLEAMDAELGAMKTPSLRDVALHPPYMHGGHFTDLEEVVHHYNLLSTEGPVGTRDPELEPLGLEFAEVRALVALLEALDGAALDPALLAPP